MTKIKVIFLYIYLFLTSLSYNSALATEQITTINILSVPETSLVISELAREYAAKNKTNVLVNFDNSARLIQNIEEGTPADLIITSHNDWLTELKQKGLINISSTQNLFSDKLVFISSNTNRKFPRFAVIENHPEFKLIINNSGNNSLSLYIDEVIFNDSTILKLTNVQLIKTSAPVENLLLANEKFFSIDFYSKIFDNQKYKIIGDVDKVNSQNISYTASIIASDNNDEAEKFLKFLKSAKSLETYKKYGFSTN